MERIQSVEGKVFSPHSHIENDGKNLNLTRQIRQTIILKDGDWTGITKEGLLRVNNTLYNLKYFDFVPCNNTQKNLISKLIPQSSKDIKRFKKKPDTSLNVELSQLGNIDKLCKKIRIWNTHQEKAKSTRDSDEFIILGRKLKKEREQIEKYLSSLKSDKNFSIDGNTLFYRGEYVTAKKVISGGF